MATAICLDCGRKILIGPKPKRGQLVACPHCNAEMEIISLSPLELDWTYLDSYEEDDDDHDDDDDNSVFWDEDDEDFDEFDDADWEEEESL
jgi:lysine biosynthesis protein LysW